jgi:hypothetical protein
LRILRYRLSWLNVEEMLACKPDLRAAAIFTNKKRRKEFALCKTLN